MKTFLAVLAVAVLAPNLSHAIPHSGKAVATAPADDSIFSKSKPHLARFAKAVAKENSSGAMLAKQKSGDTLSVKSAAPVAK